ncbi:MULTISPECIES: hypothetical protein [Paraburkholderia]|uniref:Uncharacterized protein n=1 Tax=Paraburkholderia podalyriae TaxID=1938811 RepID=A0ABR7Q1M3_9BURK|nr:hypothetical protein [Paraburkholderia podalyriae]MBC8752424.1 hypothetical protein [Paraburkholderia podalyriae]
MGISELFRIKRSDVVERDHAPIATASKPKILSMGGCVTEVVAGRMGRLAQVSHLWRVSVPCLMSNKVEGRSYFASDNHQVSERINFELTKQALRKLKSGGYEFLIFDPTSDFTNDYYEKDGCIISDMAARSMGEDWKWPEGFLANGWTRLSPKSHQYLDLYYQYLKDLIELSEQLGVPLIILKRRTCINTITRDGTHGLGDPESTEINWWVDLLWTKIDDLTNKLNVLDLNGRFSVTSFDAPYGEEKFHPIEEFYDYASYKLMYLMRFSDDLITEAIFHVYRERASRRLAIHSDREALARERDSLVIERDGLVRERDEARADLERAVQERTAIGLALDAHLAANEAKVASLLHERDALLRDRAARQSSLDQLVIENDAALAHERDKAQAENERHTQTLLTVSEARDAALGENASLALTLKSLQQAHHDLVQQHATLSLQERRLFDELRLDGGPMALRDVLPLARAWRPMLKQLGRAKRLCRRLLMTNA